MDNDAVYEQLAYVKRLLKDAKAKLDSGQEPSSIKKELDEVEIALAKANSLASNEG